MHSHVLVTPAQSSIDKRTDGRKTQRTETKMYYVISRAERKLGSLGLRVSVSRRIRRQLISENPRRDKPQPRRFCINQGQSIKVRAGVIALSYVCSCSSTILSLPANNLTLLWASNNANGHAATFETRVLSIESCFKF